MKVRSVTVCPCSSISVTSTGTCTNMRVSALRLTTCRMDVPFSSDTLLLTHLYLTVRARGLPKICQSLMEYKRVTAVSDDLAFQNGKLAPKRDANRSRFIGRILFRDSFLLFEVRC